MQRLLLVLSGLALFFTGGQAGETRRPCPEFKFELANGTAVDLSHYRGKVVTLEIMLTTCPSCKRCAQTVQKLYGELGPKGYQPLAVAINDGADKVIPKYVEQFSLEYPVGTCRREAAYRLLRHPVMMSMWVPQLVFIDRNGVIRAHYRGTDYFFRQEEKNIRELLDKLLSEEGRR